MKKCISGIMAMLLTVNLSAQFTSYVNPFVGTGGHGHTYPGAVMPHGMVQLSPDTRLTGWDGCSGYHYDDNIIYGFSHTHLSGTGVSDYGDILLMPMNGEPTPHNKEYASPFSHGDEKAAPGWYYVKLQKDNIDVNLTTSLRVGLHQYRFSKAEDNAIIIDLMHRDETLDAMIQKEDDYTISGYRFSRAWATNQKIFFVAKFNQPINSFGTWYDGKLTGKTSLKEKKVQAYCRFDLSANQEVMVKVAVSNVDLDGARRNMESEMPGWNFNEVKQAATNAWEAELGKIEVKSATQDRKALSNFYTAMYHTAIVPNLDMDVDRRYRGMDDKIHTAENYDHYTIFSLWDTYRAAHPLYALIDRKRTRDYAYTFMAMYEQYGRLPVWELASNETNCMIGYHAVSVLLDAQKKGIDMPDQPKVLDAMVRTANTDIFGLKPYAAKGLLEVDDEHENVSKTLEYAYDDWCIAEFANNIDRKEIAEEFYSRAQSYKNILDTRTGFMRPKQNGGWLTLFDPREVNNNFTEANSWQYTYYFPQDISGWLKLMKGNKNTLDRRLDSIFKANPKTTGREQVDITGLIGQYAHGNEPSHHIAYMYNYADKPYKTSQLVTKILNEFYQPRPDGLIGNEDCGQMSAWYIMSSLGFYPVLPGSDNYELTTPLFDGARINIGDGKFLDLVLNAPRKGNDFIQKVYKMDKSSQDSLRSWISYDDIKDGGRIIFEVASTPSKTYGLNHPLSKINSADITLNPVISNPDKSFYGVKNISISSSQPGVQIFYTIDGSEPTRASRKYSAPFTINKNTTIKAIAYNQNKPSKITTSEFTLRPNNYLIKYNYPYQKLYNAGGDLGLLDGLKGATEWRKGYWQGFQGGDFNVTLDLRTVKTVNEVSLNFLMESKSWIIAPTAVKVETSVDGVNFTTAATQKIDEKFDGNTTKVVPVNVSVNKKAKFLRITATQYGKLPSWHEGAGGDTHIFIDEITVK